VRDRSTKRNIPERYGIRVKNTGTVVGGYIDALGENHGIKGH
jgi:hypothetical protein